MISRRISTIIFILALSVSFIAAFLGLLHTNRAKANSFTLYVSPDGECGVVIPCYGSIQAAIDAAAEGNNIKVSQGIYTSTDDNVLVITKSVSVLGGYSTENWGESLPQEQPSTVDGEGVRRGAYLKGSGINKITLSGLTITNGHTLTGGGSGILIVTGPVEVANCLISSNIATEGNDNFGGGVAILGGFVTLTGNAIFDNEAGSGAGINVNGSEAVLSGNEIRGNTAITGGGLHILGNTTLTLNGNKIIDNEAKTGRGPAILLNEGAFIEGDNNIVADNGDNQGTGEGINVWSGTINGRHWTLANNDTIGLVASNGSVTLVNSIVAGHSTAGLFGDVIEADTTLFFNNNSNCSSGASCSESLEGDPAFADPSHYDYHITKGSAAFDKGIDADVRTDIDGEVRPAGDGFDIGADEYHFSVYLPTALNLISPTIGGNQ